MSEAGSLPSPPPTTEANPLPSATAGSTATARTDDHSGSDSDNR